MPRIELTVNLILTQREAKTLYKMLGNQTTDDRKELGLNDEQCITVSDIYALLAAVVKE